MPIALIVHGGAGTLLPERAGVVQAGCKEAALLGWRVLRAGGSALAAVEVAARALEDNPAFNAGTGACLTTDGTIELDAGMMDGRTLAVGAVASVERIKNPISLARKVLDSPHVLLVGRGAQLFALENGFLLCTFEDLLTERQLKIWEQMQAERAQDEPRFHRREVATVPERTEQQRGVQDAEKHGTVGAVALDTSGALAAATSTGGIYNQYPGRVGDSPLVGCGFYADEHAAISCTGHGEDFVRLLIAKRAADFVARGDHAHEAAEAAIAFLGTKAHGTGGLILVDHLGNVGFAWNSSNMVHAYMTEGMAEPIAGV